MARRRRYSHRWEKRPGVLTHGIEDIGDLWSKLDWEVDQFEIRRDDARYPDPFSMSFIALNVSITLNSLQDWFCTKLVQESRRGKSEVWTDAEARALVRDRITYEAIFRNIANTAKHGSYRSEDVDDLRARMTARFRDDLQRELDALDENDGAEFILRHWNQACWRLTYHIRAGEDVELDAHAIFCAAREEWANLLREHGWLD